MLDEFDALFGKRVNTRDRGDRFANTEVGYLLQRLETYQRVAILTTNLPGGIDDAFRRHLDFLIEFALPGRKVREEIWKRVFPNTVSISRLNMRLLSQLDLAGSIVAQVAQ